MRLGDQNDEFSTPAALLRTYAERGRKMGRLCFHFVSFFYLSRAVAFSSAMIVCPPSHYTFGQGDE